MIKAQLEGAGERSTQFTKIVLYSKGTTTEYKISLHRRCSHLRKLQNHPLQLKNHSQSENRSSHRPTPRQNKNPKKKNLKKGKGKEKKRECEREKKNKRKRKGKGKEKGKGEGIGERERREEKRGKNRESSTKRFFLIHSPLQIHSLAQFRHWT